MASLMNGLSSAGSGLAGFAANYGAEAQKADAAMALQGNQQTFQTGLLQQKLAGEAELARQADAMLAAREHTGRAETAGYATTTASTLAQTQSTARLQEAEIANKALTPEQKLWISLGIIPDPTKPAPLSGASPSSSSNASGLTPTGVDTSNPIVAKKLGLPMPGSEDALRRAIAEGVSTSPEFKDKPADVQASEVKKRLASASASLSSDALDTIADRTLAGDTSALAGLGYGEGGAANRAAAQERITQKLKDKGLTGADLAAAIASFGGEKAGARTAGTREANVGMAVTEAQLFMPLALEASKAVPRTQFPTLNSIMLAAEKGAGGESVVRLAVATNSLVNAYARAITPSGIPTEGNQTRARELLDKAWADGQYAAAIDQLGKEMKAAKASPIQQQSEQRARISGRSTGEGAPPTDQAATPTPENVATPKVPAIGEVQQGYTFTGGNPADPASWKAVK